MDATAVSPGGAGSHRVFVLGLALALTLANALKPVAVDDPAYLRQAGWWAAHPLDPLGGEALNYQKLVPASQVASAPVGIAWLALGSRLAGGAEWRLKLWLFPFAWLLAWGLHDLLRHAAPSLAKIWLVGAILSPALLPSFGFMLEVPMLALAMASLAVFARGVQKDPWQSALAAGVLAGLALQTKYSGAPILVALVAWGACRGRWRAGALAALTALALFGAIEMALRLGAGASPLVAYAASRGMRDPDGHLPWLTGWRLMRMAGTVAPVLIPLGLTALGAPRRWVWAALAAIPLGYACFSFAPPGVVLFLDRVTAGRLINFENVTIAWMGPALAAVAALAAWRACRAPNSFPARALAVWLGAECLMAPFVSASASVRRVLGALLAFSLVLARLAHDVVRRDPARRADVVACVTMSVALGLAFWGVDVDSALADRRALALVTARLATEHDRGQVAFVGNHWTSFQYAASRSGWREVALGRSALRGGDWLVVPFEIGGHGVALDPSGLALVDSVPLPHRLPVTTRRSFYDGRTAFRRVDPGWAGARIWRVIADGEVLGLAGSLSRADSLRLPPLPPVPSR